jgi:hypothetical protein
VATAEIKRPTKRTAYVRFARRDVGKPRVLRFAAESVTRGERCPSTLGCRDTAPNAPDTGSLRLRASGMPE